MGGGGGGGERAKAKGGGGVSRATRASSFLFFPAEVRDLDREDARGASSGTRARARSSSARERSSASSKEGGACRVRE